MEQTNLGTEQVNIKRRDYSMLEEIFERENAEVMKLASPIVKEALNEEKPKITFSYFPKKIVEKIDYKNIYFPFLKHKKRLTDFNYSLIIRENGKFLKEVLEGFHSAPFNKATEIFKIYTGEINYFMDAPFVVDKGTPSQYLKKAKVRISYRVIEPKKFCDNGFLDYISFANFLRDTLNRSLRISGGKANPLSVKFEELVKQELSEDLSLYFSEKGIKLSILDFSTYFLDLTIKQIQLTNALNLGHEFFSHVTHLQEIIANEKIRIRRALKEAEHEENLLDLNHKQDLDVIALNYRQRLALFEAQNKSVLISLEAQNQREATIAALLLDRMHAMQKIDINNRRLESLCDFQERLEESKRISIEKFENIYLRMGEIIAENNMNPLIALPLLNIVENAQNYLFNEERIGEDSKKIKEKIIEEILKQQREMAEAEAFIKKYPKEIREKEAEAKKYEKVSINVEPKDRIADILKDILNPPV